MIDILHKITSSPRGKRLRKRIGGAGTSECAIQTQGQYTQMHCQILQISQHGYNEGERLLKSKKYDDAKECFESALAARLVLYGPENESVLRAHERLRTIAFIQGDAKKEVYHMLKTKHIQSLTLLNAQNEYHDTVDWSQISQWISQD